MKQPEIDDYLAPYAPEQEETRTSLVSAVRRYLEDTRAWLAARQSEGASGGAINLANSDAFDRLIRRLHGRAESEYFSAQGQLGARMAIAAIGGYARREMSIGSDVDLLFLVEGEMSPLAAHVAERVQYVLWDAGVQLGAAVRTVDECIDLGREDVSACTAILVARFLGGDATLFHEFSTAVRRRLIPDLEAFIRNQREAMADRHRRFGDSLYLLQPNLKEGAGGLRDYHAAYWVARASDPMVREVGDLLQVGLFTESEMAEYRTALEFLWRVRNQLHLLSGRKNDQMSFEDQEVLAKIMGFGEGREGELPVERFMREYYRHARAVQNLSEIVIEQCHARSRPRHAPPATRPGEDGFRVAEDHLEIPHAAHLRERPVRLLTAFAVAQDHQIPLSRTARRLVRENLHLVDDAFRRSPEASGVFLRILSSEHRVMRSLMAMNEVGLLGRYLPEWEHTVCRWQHVVYHTYTVDVHSIFLVEELRRLWQGKYASALARLTEMVRAVPDLPALYLGCLLHDIGKGFGADHSSIGADRARACLERLGLDPERIERVVFIVRHHLLMSHVAQRRDLGDPKVIVEFARILGDRVNLHNLYLATFADMRASSSSAWTEWRGELLEELFERTSEFLETGGDDPTRAIEQVEARIEARVEAARRELQGLGVAESRVESFFEMMPRRYFVNHTPRQIARHALAMFSLGPERRMSTAVRHMRGGFSEFIICTHDVHGLYSDVAGSLAAAGINILGSHVYTTRTGLALEVYRITTPPGGDEERQEVFQELEDVLERVLSGRMGVAELLARRRRRLLRRALRAGSQPPAVSIRNDVSDFYTVVDITADDRLGLLYDLTRTIAAEELEIYVSKATTVLDQVADTFYVKDAQRNKLTEPERLERLERALLAAAVGEESGGGVG